MAVTVVSTRIDKIEASCAVHADDYLRIDQFDEEGCYVHVRDGGDHSTMRLSGEDARALIKADPALRGALKADGHLRRDPRAKERKKAGQPGARKRFQFSKR